MNFTRSAFARRVAIAMLTAFVAALPQIANAQGNPLAGTWKFVPEKSTFTPGPARYQSMTLTFADSGEPVMNIEGMDAQGKPVKATYTAVPDGKPHPVTGVPNIDSGMWTRNSDTNVSYRYLKGKSIMALGTRVLSADGSTITFREQIYDDKGKQTSTAVMTFVNPDVKVASVTPAVAATAPGAVQTGMTPDETAGTEALAKGADDEAIRFFTKVIDAKQSTPRQYYDHISRGVAYARKGQNEQALADFDAAVKLKPDDADGHFRRGSTFATLKQYQSAIDDLNAVIQADAMNAAAYRLRGFSYNMLQKYMDGAADNEKACAINKEFCLN